MRPKVYYNEHDPFAAAWLRELAKYNLIAPGDVDERSIEDVVPSDLGRYRQCHFFAGIGVWSLALRRAGWPDDKPIWTGSCPCQPFSAAGKGSGFADERHLWPAFFHLIEQCQPAIVVGEQVASKDGLAWLDLVQADLEGAGYSSGALDTCAAGFGAPHIRQRLYWLAHANDARLEGWRGVRERAAERAAGERGMVGWMADAREAERGPGRSGCDGARGGGARGESPGRDDTGGLADADRGERGRFADGEGGERDGTSRGRQQSDGESKSGDDARGMADADTRSEGMVRNGNQHLDSRGAGNTWVRSWGSGSNDRPGPTNGLWRAADWLGCRDGKWRPVSPGSFPLVAAGTVRNRVGALRGAGNALNLAQAQGFIEALKESGVGG